MSKTIVSPAPGNGPIQESTPSEAVSAANYARKKKLKMADFYALAGQMISNAPKKRGSTTGNNSTLGFNQKIGG